MKGGLPRPEVKNPRTDLIGHPLLINQGVIDPTLHVLSLGNPPAVIDSILGFVLRSATRQACLDVRSVVNPSLAFPCWSVRSPFWE